MSETNYDTDLHGGKFYSIPEIYGIAVKAFRGIKDMVKCRKTNLLDEKLRERIMLAVTMVNGCAMCSYAHTEMALKAGLSNKEIQSLLSGEFPDIPLDEVKAVFFAQHYADVRGKMDKDSWKEIAKEYGLDKARCILAAARIMMLGNAVGMALTSIKSRLKGEKGDSRSSVPYEIIFIITIIPLTLLSLLQAGLLNLFKAPI